MKTQSFVGQTGDRFESFTIFIVRERYTQETYAHFSTREKANNYIQREQADNDVVVAEVIIDYYAN